MFRLPAWLDRYRTLPSRVIWFAAGQFLVNLITTAQFLLLNLFLKDRGLDDPSIAALTSQDQDEGVAAFLEKRRPDWKGK